MHYTKAQLRRLVVRAIEDSIVLIGLFVSMWLVGTGFTLIFKLFT